MTEAGLVEAVMKLPTPAYYFQRSEDAAESVEWQSKETSYH